MATFTAGVPLNIRLEGGFECIGVAGATHRIPDELTDEFERDFAPNIPGFAWITQDEKTAPTQSGAGFTIPSGNLVISATSSTVTLGGDVNLYRPGADTLQTNDSFSALRSATTDWALSARVDGEAHHRFLVTADGAINIGAGSAARDVNLYRSAANVLATDDSFLVGGIYLNTNTALIRGGGTAFPSAPSTNDRYYRTDWGEWFYYDGTRWLSHPKEVTIQFGVSGALTLGNLPLRSGDSIGVWLRDVTWNYSVVTTHSTAHYWTLSWNLYNNTGWATPWSADTDKSTATSWVNPASASISYNADTTWRNLYLYANPTGSPGTLNGACTLRYQWVGT